MIAKPVHELAACSSDHIVCRPQFQAEFVLQVNVEVLVFLRVRRLRTAHFDERFRRSGLQYFKEFLPREEVLGVVKEKGCDTVGRLTFNAFLVCVGE